MNNKYRYTKFVILFFIVLFTACQPYEYNFENGYDTGAEGSNVSVDTSGFDIDKSMYARARVFPGLVDSTEVRLEDAIVTLDLDKKYVSPFNLGIQVVPQPIISTGLYAGPGELIEIEVPSGVYGLTVQVGSHTDDLTDLVPAKRDPVIYTVKALFPGINTVRNPFGGYIWIKAKTSSNLSGLVDIHFKGVVKAPDYVLGKTTSTADWKEEVLNSKVPWLELQSNYASFSVSRLWVERAITSGNLDEIEEILSEWDEIILENFYNFNGLSVGNNDLEFRAPDYKQRFVLDAQLEGGVYIHNGGQPIVAQNSQFWFDEWTNIEQIKKGESVGTFRALGTNFMLNKSPYWTSVSDATSFFTIYKTASENGIIPDILKGNQSVQAVFPEALSYAAADSTKYFNNNINKELTLFTLLPFVQLFENISNPNTTESGWEFNGYLIKKAKTEFLANDDTSKQNFFYNALCEYTETDYASFFDAWGIPIGDYWRDLNLQYPPLDKALWEYNPITGTGGDRNYISPYIYPLRTDWVFLNYAKGESSSESADDPQRMLDGNYNTLWHSCYSCNPDPLLPFDFEVDMTEETLLDGFYIISGNRRPQQVIVSVSTDGINYTEVGDYELENKSNKQFLELPNQMSVRYFKFSLPKVSFSNSEIVGDVNDDINERLNSIAEFGAYKLR